MRCHAKGCGAPVRLTGGISRDRTGVRPIFCRVRVQAFLFGPAPSWIVDDLTALGIRQGRVSLSTGPIPGKARSITHTQAAAHYQDGEDVQFTDGDRSPVSATPRPDREHQHVRQRSYGHCRRTASWRQRLFVPPFAWRRCRDAAEGFARGPSRFGEAPTRPSTNFMLGASSATEFALDGTTVFRAATTSTISIRPTIRCYRHSQLGAEARPAVSQALGGPCRGPKACSSYANYAQGFRATTPFQVNYENLAFGYTSLPNPERDLAPENQRKLEGGLSSTRRMSPQAAGRLPCRL